MLSTVTRGRMAIGLVLMMLAGWVVAEDKPGKVRGAMWHVVAESATAKKKEKFKFRAHDGIIYDTLGRKAGAIDPIANVKPGEAKSNVVFKEPLRLSGEMLITQRKKGHWSGVLKAKDGDEWNCLLDVVDR